jgi:hypothetical protein
MVAQRGVPDFIICLSGEFVAIELKMREGAAGDELQAYIMEKIKKAGGHAYVATPRNWQQIYRKLKALSTV